jgi:hypothetical protein
MGVEKFLNLSRRNVLATTDDHIFDASDDVAVTLVVDRGQVARVHPARRVNYIGRCSSPQYPRITEYPRVHNSPGAPLGSIDPLSSTIFTSMCG